MGFYFRVAPGLRIRATSRGLRASVGPRALRLHVGAGGPGISTGAGPVTYYQPLSGRRSRSSGSSDQRRLLAQARAAEMAEQAEALEQAITALSTVQLAEFPPALPPRAAPVVVPAEQELIRQYEQAAVEGVSRWDLAERGRRKEQARALAVQDRAKLVASAADQQKAGQAALDAAWARLCANDPDAVLAELTEAFGDNDAQTIAVSVEGDEVTLLMLAPDESELPERRPKITPAGNLSLAKLTKAERNALAAALVCGHVLVTLKECFATAPGLGSARVVVLRKGEMDAYGKQTFDCIMAGVWRRDALAGVRWADVPSPRIVQDTAAELHATMASGGLRPLDLAQEPELAKVVAAVEWEPEGQ